MQEVATKRACSAKPKYWESLLLSLSAFSTAGILGCLLKFSQYGIDFTDESYYIVSISNPFIYDWSASQFDYIYHPLYQLLCGNIATLRQANILITFGLAWLLVNTFFGVLVPGSLPGKLERLIITLGFATVSLVFREGLPTPSYNSLALQALLVAATGLLLAESGPSRSSLLGYVLIGLGGWLAFMAKPSTAAGLAILAGMFLLLARKLNIRLLLVSVGVALLFLMLSALVIDGSLFKFIDRVKIAVEFADYLGAGYTFRQFIRLDDFQLNSYDKIVLISVAMLSFLAAFFLCSERQPLKFAGFTLSALLFSAILIAPLGVAHRRFELGTFRGLLIWAVPFSAAALGLASASPEAFFQNANFSLYDHPGFHRGSIRLCVWHRQ